MENNIMIFENNQVEVFELNGQVLFNPYDVGRCLDLTESAVKMAIKDMNERQVVKLTNSKVNNTDFRKLHNTGENFLTESGVYKLIFKSRKPNAEKFQDWVIDKVLPSIRKNGGYIANQENLSNKELLAKAFLVSQNIIEEKEKINKELQEKNNILSIKNEEMKPKANYYDKLVDRELLLNFRNTAKEIGIGERVMINFLIKNKIIFRGVMGKLMPYANFVKKGYFQIKEGCSKEKNNTYYQTLITVEGINYILQKLKKANLVA